MRRKKMFMIILTLILFVIIGTTYAFIRTTTSGNKRQIITSGEMNVVLEEDENNLTIESAMPTYDEVGMIQNPFTFRLKNNTDKSIAYKIKLVDITEEEKIEENIVRYGLIKKEQDPIIDSLTNLEDHILDSGIIKGLETINYSLRLWIDINVEEEELIKGKSLKYKLEVVLENLQNLEDIAFSDLGDSCKTYDDGTDTFLVGQCKNNYVWYSGKLWRVVLKNNETDAVKMITDNDIATFPYSATTNNKYENNYVDQWLQQEFLPTLYDYKNYLIVDSLWDATMDSSLTPSKPRKETTVIRPIGLLNSYEYYTTYNNSNGHATEETGYLNNQTYQWLMTANTTSTVNFVNHLGALGPRNPANGCGIRPVINVKSNLIVLSGNGTIDSPYQFVNLQPNGEKVLLNTRYSGEYITFNQELYRIIRVENNLTKIISVDTPTGLESLAYHSSAVTRFASANIRIELDKYYQNLDSTIRDMIERNTIWYFGEIRPGANYKAGICKTVDANIDTLSCPKTTEATSINIGLPRVGELFSGQMTRKTKASFWSITPFESSTYMRRVTTSGASSGESPTATNSVHPTMYLKQNVVIAQDNTGNGTYEHPYSIEIKSS